MSMKYKTLVVPHLEKIQNELTTAVGGLNGSKITPQRLVELINSALKSNAYVIDMISNE